MVAGVNCMYPLCTCYGETPYLCEQEGCSWPNCECGVEAPTNWEKCMNTDKGGATYERDEKLFAQFAILAARAGWKAESLQKIADLQDRVLPLLRSAGRNIGQEIIEGLEQFANSEHASTTATPRTDAEVEQAKKYASASHGLWVSAEFARDLERDADMYRDLYLREQQAKLEAQDQLSAVATCSKCGASESEPCRGNCERRSTVAGETTRDRLIRDLVTTKQAVPLTHLATLQAAINLTDGHVQEMLISAYEGLSVSATAGEGWIPVSERLPENTKNVIAFYLNSHGNGRRVRAFYAAQHQVEDDSDDGLPGSEEHNGTMFVPAGWYETNESEDYYYRVDGEVSHWHPMPPSPVPDSRQS